MKAALVIQNWYRRYRARLTARQHYALAIFQSVEYADEQGQMQLSNFFSYMLENYGKTRKEDSAVVTRLFESTMRENKDRQEYVGLVEVPDSYDGPRLHFPLTSNDIDLLLQAFKQQQNGLPSENNPYVFNGDFVDRGGNSMEILMILLVSFLVYPTDLHLNRGNHEDFMMNLRVSAMEFSAFRILKERMLSRKTDLINAFQLRDYSRSGRISLAQWAFSMESILGLNLPWRSLSSQLVNIDHDGNVDYMSSFEDVHIEKPVKEMESSIIETLYRYRSDLEIIFNVIDTDHSGLISMDEFRTMWKLFNTHYNVHIDDSQIDELANTMDFNKDGSIDFNEFLKAFYVVHK
ncbi:protein phosphatase with EF hand calcium-binding domain 1 [Cricetulus griseus]